MLFFLGILLLATTRLVEAQPLECVKGNDPGTSQSPTYPSFYNGCDNKTKNCMGVGPSDCLQTKDCDVLATFVKGMQDDIMFQLASRPSLDTGNRRYVAIGISEDEKMGNDTVLSCIQYDSQCDVVLSYNTGDKQNTIVLPTQDADQLRTRTTNLEVDTNRGGMKRLVCTFTIPLRLVTNNVEFDMSAYNYYILLSEGRSTSIKTVSYHLVQGSFDSGAALNVTTETFQKVLSLKKEGIKNSLSFHAFAMPFSFLCLLPTAILIARFLKESHLDKRIFQKRIWLSIHSGCHSLAFILTVLSISLLIVYMEFIPRDDINPKHHYQLGLTCIFIFLVNVGTGFFHGFVEGYYATKLVTGIVHWALGAITYALATTQIFLVPYLVPSHLNSCTLPSLIVLAWAFIFVIVYITLTIVKFIGDTQTTKALEKIPSSTLPASTTASVDLTSEPIQDLSNGNAQLQPETKPAGPENTKSSTKEPDKSSTKKSDRSHTSSKGGSSTSSKKKNKKKGSGGAKKSKVKPSSAGTEPKVTIKDNPKNKAPELTLVDKLLQNEYLDQQEKPVKIIPMTNTKNKDFDVKFENFPDFDETALFHDFQLDPATDADDDLWTVSRSRRRRNRFRVFYQFPLKIFSVKENPQTKSFDVIIGGFFIISFGLTIAFFAVARPERLGDACSVDNGETSQWFVLK